MGSDTLGALFAARVAFFTALEFRKFLSYTPIDRWLSRLTNINFARAVVRFSPCAARKIYKHGG